MNNDLKSYIKTFLSDLYQVQDEKKGAHPNYPDFTFIISIGDFMSVEAFDIPEWTEYYENGKINQELKKRAEFIEYKFTSAGYSRDDGGMSKWSTKKAPHNK